MSWENENRSMKVHLYLSFSLSVVKRRIVLDHCAEGRHQYIRINIDNNTIDV